MKAPAEELDRHASLAMTKRRIARFVFQAAIFASLTLSLRQQDARGIYLKPRH